MYCFIINPCSGCGRGLRVWKKIEQQLMCEGAEYRAFIAEEPGQASKIAGELTKGKGTGLTIAVVGADDTFGEVLDGLNMGENVTLGYIPAGSRRDLAKSLRLPRSPKRCLRRIFCPRQYRCLDYGLLTYGEDSLCHRRFAVSAGMGLTAAACRSVPGGISGAGRGCLGGRFGSVRRFGKKIRYLAGWLWQLVKAKPSKGYILLDRTRKVEFNHMYFVSACIHPSEGGGFYFAPEADPGDGKLEICVASHSSKLRLIPMLIRARLPLFVKRKGVRTYRCREARIHMDRPAAVHTDGERGRIQNDLELQCIEKKIRVIV